MVPPAKTCRRPFRPPPPRGDNVSLLYTAYPTLCAKKRKQSSTSPKPVMTTTAKRKETILPKNTSYVHRTSPFVQSSEICHGGHRHNNEKKIVSTTSSSQQQSTPRTHLIKVRHSDRFSQVPVLLGIHHGPPPFLPTVPLHPAIPFPHNAVVQRPRVVQARLTILQVRRPCLEVLDLRNGPNGTFHRVFTRRTFGKVKCATQLDNNNNDMETTCGVNVLKEASTKMIQRRG